MGVHTGGPEEERGRRRGTVLGRDGQSIIYFQHYRAHSGVDSLLNRPWYERLFGCLFAWIGHSRNFHVGVDIGGAQTGAEV